MNGPNFYYPGLIEERARMLRERQTTVAAPIRIVSNTTGKHFCPQRDIVHTAERPGADRALQLPSRVGNRLHYRDGRVVEVLE
jgi:hypothetical protein